MKRILLIGIVLSLIVLCGCNNYNYPESECDEVCFSNHSSYSQYTGDYKDGTNKDLCQKHCNYGIYKEINWNE